MSYPASSTWVVPHKCGINSAVPEYVTGGWLRDAGPAGGRLDGSSNYGFVQVVVGADSGADAVEELGPWLPDEVARSVTGVPEAHGGILGESPEANQERSFA